MRPQINETDERGEMTYFCAANLSQARSKTFQPVLTPCKPNRVSMHHKEIQLANCEERLIHMKRQTSNVRVDTGEFDD